MTNPIQDQLAEALSDLQSAWLMRPSCQAGFILKCACLKCADDRANKALAAHKQQAAAGEAMTDERVVPNWTGSRTLATEPWKSPYHTLAERLEIADGAISFRDDVIANLRTRIATQPKAEQERRQPLTAKELFESMTAVDAYWNAYGKTRTEAAMLAASVVERAHGITGSDLPAPPAEKGGE